ncbi:thioesterase domain-containing protein [Burkholderia sp. ISTR5]|uniref:thioesterase domain-containing protein n=1 Tax=Burkholderia sp. ISTR5 TaxID=2500161 RepID=UPI00136B077E|nr:alpha/beta fold hydrolase [Burkholderia sp. ISTR5]NBI50345.1 alpha/beta fold hydrolase [Burkholderia sp. ISTR5]
MKLAADASEPMSSTVATPRAEAGPARPAAAVPRTLFLLPDYTGLAGGMAALAACLAADGPLECLPCTPLDGAQPDTMEGLAAHYVEAIRERQPEGPYRLAGWSFGGLLAYEVAMQLVGRDQGVEFLGMVDTNPPPTSMAPRLAAVPAAPGAQLLGLLRFAAEPAPAGDLPHRELRLLCAPGDAKSRQRLVDTVAAVPADATLAEVREACHRAEVWPEALARISDAELGLLLRRWRAHDHALTHYEPFPTSTFVHLFRLQSAGAVQPDQGEAPFWESVLHNGEYHFVPPDSSDSSDSSDLPALTRSTRTLGQALMRAMRAEVQKLTGRRAPPRERGYDPHIPIRRSSGRRDSVVLIPGAGSVVSAFMPFCDALDEAWDLHGLQPRGFDGVLVPHASVEAATLAYLARIVPLMVERGAPVHLIGHSFGGWLAFDLACRLQACGTPPASLTLIDSEAPGQGLRLGRAYTFSEISWALVRALEHGAGRRMGIEPERYFGAGRRQQWDLLHQGMRELRLVHARSGLHDTRALVRSYATAMRTVYRPAAQYAGPATLVLAEQEVESNRGAFEAWLRCIPELRVRHGAGNHYTMLQAPHVASLAQWWQARN